MKASWESTTPQLVRLTQGCIEYEDNWDDRCWSDIILEVEKVGVKNEHEHHHHQYEHERWRITQRDLQRVFSQPSSNHKDGTICIECQDHTMVELHIVIASPMYGDHPDILHHHHHHQILRGYSHLYKPIKGGMPIGHRGCGVNQVCSIQLTKLDYCNYEMIKL